VGDELTIQDSASVRYLRLNRPERFNALNGELLLELDDELDQVERNPNIRVVVVTGTGRAFCAGADLGELDGLSVADARVLLERGQATFRRIERMPVPIIAAVNGVALGGGFELALATSFIVAVEGARFGLPEASLGLIPGYGGTQRLPARIGRQAALAVMLTTNPVTAHRAFQLGLIAEEPIPATEFHVRVEEIAQSVAANGPEAVRRILEATLPPTSMDEGLRIEAELAARAVASDESVEGIAAFREKRIPKFSEASGPS